MSGARAGCECEVCAVARVCECLPCVDARRQAHAATRSEIDAAFLVGFEVKAEASLDVIPAARKAELAATAVQIDTTEVAQ